MSIAEPTTQPCLSLPSREQMPEEIWGLWLPLPQEWLMDMESIGTYIVTFSKQDAKDYIADQIHFGDRNEGDLVPVLIWRNPEINQ